jgi:hypothetical protein
MQTLLLSLAMLEPSPRALMIMGAITVALMAILLRRKLG